MFCIIYMYVLCMLFINISSDNVQLHDGSREVFLDRSGIEMDLGPVLVEWVKTGITKMFVLN